MTRKSRSRRLLLLTVGIGAVLAFAGGLAVRGSGQDPPPGDGWEVYHEIHRLRVEVGDYPAARAVAENFLTQHPEHDLLRQAVEYEYGATYYAEQDWAQALPLFEAVVSTYLNAGFDEGGEFFFVDDAQFLVGVIRQVTGDPQGAIAAYDTHHD